MIPLDLALANGQETEQVPAVKVFTPEVSMVALTREDDEEELAVAALRVRAQDCLARDWLDGPQLLQALRRAVERHRAETHFRRLRQTLTHLDGTVARLQQLTQEAARAKPVSPAGAGSAAPNSGG